MYKLGSRTFSSKSELQKFMSNYLQNTTKIPPTDKSWLFEFFSGHKYWYQKGRCVIDIIIKRNSYGNKGFYLVKDNCEEEDISYRKTIYPPSENQDENKALRCEIIYQIRNFRKKTINSHSICEICNKKLKNNKSTHVDHIIKFRDLVKKFKKKYDLKYVDNYTTGEERFISDETIKNNWKEYHLKNSKLRLLCKQCNMKLK